MTTPDTSAVIKPPTTMIMIQVSEQVREEIRKITDLEGSTMSGYVRALIIKDLRDRGYL